MDKPPPPPNIAVPQSSTIINGRGNPKVSEPYSYNSPKKAKGSSSSSNNNNNISFMASLISISIYISLVYICHISPSQLLHNPTFWWLISNTLVLIIAADYGAFASSSVQPHRHHDDHDHIYDEMIRRQRSADSTRTSVRTRFPPPNIIAATAPLPPLPAPPELVTKEQAAAVTLPFAKTTRLTRRNSAPEAGRNSHNNNSSKSVLKKGRRRNDDGSESARFSSSCPPNDDVSVGTTTTAFRRSKSERGKRRVVIDESRNVVRKFEIVVEEPGGYRRDEEDSDDEDDEYSKLSTEELNKRVEDFIQRFNTQIRLQNQAYNTLIN